MQDNISKSSFQDLLSNLKQIATDNLRRVPELAAIEPDLSHQPAAADVAKAKPKPAKLRSAPGFRAPKGVTLYPIGARPGQSADKGANQLPKTSQQKGALMAEFGLDVQEFNELLADFKSIDRDGSGEVERAEVAKVLSRERNGQQPSAAEVRKMIAQFDHNADGKITFREYVKTLSVSNQHPGISDRELGSLIPHLDDEITLITSARSHTDDAADGLQPDEVIASPVPDLANQLLLEAHPEEPFKDTFRTLFLGGTPPCPESSDPQPAAVVRHGKPRPARVKRSQPKQRASTAGRRRGSKDKSTGGGAGAPIDFSQFGGIFASDPNKIPQKKPASAGTRRAPIDFSKFASTEEPTESVAAKSKKPVSAGMRSPIDFAQFGGVFNGEETPVAAVQDPKRRRRPLTAPTFGKRTSFKDLSTQMWRELQIQLDEANDLSKVLGLSKKFARGESSTRIVMTTAGTSEHLSGERFDKELSKLKKASQELHHRQRQQARVAPSHRQLPAAQQAEIANQRLETLLADTKKLSSDLMDQLSVLTGGAYSNYSVFE